MQPPSDAARARAEALFKLRDPQPGSARPAAGDYRASERDRRQRQTYLRALGIADDGNRRHARKPGPPAVQ